MADVKFDYPTASAPTTTLTLPRGGTMTDDAFVHALNQKIERKKTGRPIVKRNGSGFTQLQFTLRCMRSSAAGVGHETDRADVIEFIDEVVEGASKSFDFTDSDGTVRNVFCMNETLDFSYHYGTGSGIVDKCTLLLEETGE